MSIKKSLRKSILRVLNLTPLFIIRRVCHFNWFEKRYKIDFERTFDLHILQVEILNSSR